MEGGREDKFLVSFRIEWHSGGTRHCGGRWSLTVFKLLCKKQNKQKKQLALYIVEGRPLPDSGFSRGAGREAAARAMSLAACEGVRSRSVEAWVLQSPWPPDCLLSWDLCALGAGGGEVSFIALMT